MTREELIAQAQAKIKAQLLARLGAPAPRAVEPPPPKARRTRKPAAPRAVAVETAPSTAPEWRAYIMLPRVTITLSNTNHVYSYRITRPRDYDPAAPIHFVGVEQDNKYEYIGFIRSERGPFMWGRKSKISASDPRVILFDDAMHSILTNDVMPERIVIA
jgi:hypothetical protein